MNLLICTYGLLILIIILFYYNCLNSKYLTKIVINEIDNLSSLFLNSVMLHNQILNKINNKYKKLKNCKGDKKAIVVLLNFKEIYKFIDNNYLFLNKNYHDKLIFYITEKKTAKEEIYRNIKYDVIDVSDIFFKFPYKFNESFYTPNFVKRGKWNYQHMCRFFFKIIFEHISLCDIDIYLRLDSESILNTTINLFSYMTKSVVYLHNKILNDAKLVVKGLKEYITSFVKTIKPKIKDSKNYHIAFRKTVLMYYNNLEICRLRFFRSKEMFQFINLIDLSYGQFIYRWGDAPLRYIALSLFAANYTKIPIPKNIKYCHQCKKG